MNKVIMRLGENIEWDAGQAGGKASVLNRLKSEGFDVPDGIVLTTDFFSPWLQTMERSEEWSALIGQVSEERCFDLQEKARTLTFDNQQREALKRALEDFSNSVPFAVRSSSPEEDLLSRSFAGLYESVMDVEKKDLESAVREVFASAFGFRVFTYKIEQGLGIDLPTVAVIVQAMVQPKASGVAFSINPVTNSYDELVIEAVKGHGGALVQGAVTPEISVVNKSRRKAETLKATEIGESELLQLTEDVCRIEASMGHPVDVEWALEDGKIKILQARAVTGYVPLHPELITEPGRPKRLYVDSLLSSQGFEQPMSVLGMDLYRLVTERVMSRGIMPSEDGGYLVHCDGKQYMDVSNMLKGMGRRLGLQTVGDQAPVLKTLTNELLSEYTAPKRTGAMRSSRRAMIRIALETVPMMLSMMARPSKTLTDMQKLADGAAVDLRILEGKADLSGAVETGLKILVQIARRAVAYVPGHLAMMELRRLFKGNDYEEDLAAAAMNLPSNPTADMGRRLFELACEEEIIRTSSKEEFQVRLKTNGYTKNVHEKIEAFLSLYGDRCHHEIDVAVERPRHQPGTLYLQLAGIETEQSQYLSALSRKREALVRLRQEAQSRGRSKRFEKLLFRYENLFGLRELPKHLVVVWIGRMRELALEIGAGLAEEERLQDPQDIFYLKLEEVARAQRDPEFALSSLVELRREELRIAAGIVRRPLVFDSRGRIFDEPPSLGLEEWQGLGISPGQASGPVKVMHNPFEKRVLPGEVLVLRSSEPAWTPVFINAAAVIMEVGGMLQHGAIIAREYGIPCVSGIQGATILLKDGDMVEVDGARGIARKMNTHIERKKTQ